MTPLEIALGDEEVQRTLGRIEQTCAEARDEAANARWQAADAAEQARKVNGSVHGRGGLRDQVRELWQRLTTVESEQARLDGEDSADHHHRRRADRRRAAKWAAVTALATAGMTLAAAWTALS